MVLPLQEIGAAGTPPKLILLDPCDAPKPLPLIVTVVPTGPDVGEKLVIEGGTVNVPQVAT
jgi:hypothetical protein